MIFTALTRDTRRGRALLIDEHERAHVYRDSEAAKAALALLVAVYGDAVGECTQLSTAHMFITYDDPARGPLAAVNDAVDDDEEEEEYIIDNDAALLEEIEDENEGYEDDEEIYAPA